MAANCSFRGFLSPLRGPQCVPHVLVPLVLGARGQYKGSLQQLMSLDRQKDSGQANALTQMDFQSVRDLEGVIQQMYEFDQSIRY
jgi:hypothetical protein